MSIKYGESKEQYVKGKRVKNLQIHVDLDRVCVDWEEWDDKE